MMLTLNPHSIPERLHYGGDVGLLLRIQRLPMLRIGSNAHLAKIGLAPSETPILTGSKACMVSASLLMLMNIAYLTLTTTYAATALATPSPALFAGLDDTAPSLSWPASCHSP
jgi:hypothetical protein